jgi:hypothetical protein
MKNFKKIWLASFLSIYLLAGVLLFVPIPSYAADSIFDVNTDVNFTPQIGIPESEFTAQEKVGVGTTGVNKQGETVVTSDLLAKYINAFYKWGLSIAAVISVLTLMAAGIIWITSRGDSGAITKAKGMIAGSLTGIALLVGAWFILNTINPNLTKLPAIELTIVTKTTLGCCDEGGSGRLTKSNDCKGDFFPNSKLTSQGQCEKPICCIDITYNLSKACFTTYPNNCPSSKKGAGGIMHNYEISPDSCSTVDKCKATGSIIASCDGVQEGSQCLNTNADCWCYNGVAYLNKFGEDKEPCGNEANSKCDPDAEQNGKSCNGDLGGRDCKEGLYCCKFSEGGGRINK